MRRKQPEAEIQHALCQHLEARAVPGLVWFAVPNGGVRSKIEARIFKGLGVKPGVSDMILLHAGMMYAVELKAKGGKPTKAQTEFLLSVNEAGGTALLAEDLDTALIWLEHWGLLRGVLQASNRSSPSKHQVNGTMKDGTQTKDHLR